MINGRALRRRNWTATHALSTLRLESILLPGLQTWSRPGLIPCCQSATSSFKSGLEVFILLRCVPESLNSLVYISPPHEPSTEPSQYPALPALVVKTDNTCAIQGWTPVLRILTARKTAVPSRNSNFGLQRVLFAIERRRFRDRCTSWL